ncbi:MAG: hypothetical protein COC15_04120 [Legionellales bacterium]|nr:MAG: hypothetical protein COC15_04120 [Legionellales bacterium]
MQSIDIIITTAKQIIECEPNKITNVIIDTNNTDLIINLSQEQAQCNIYGLQLAQNTETYSLNLLINHTAPNCISNTILRGVYTDNAIGNITAKIHVHPYAYKTNAALENKNLLLSNTATVNTLPQLEIYNDDVKCSHGATIGALDVEALFYLQSRGIAYSAARKILIESFISPTFFNEQIKYHAQKKLSNF